VRVSTITVTFRADEVTALLSLCASIQGRPPGLHATTVHDASQAILRLADVECNDSDPEEVRVLPIPAWVCQALVGLSRLDETLAVRRRADAARTIGSGPSRPKRSPQRNTRAQSARSTPAVSADRAADVAAAGQRTAVVADPSGACQSGVALPVTVDAD
jgi:hypothetical protein